MFLSDPFLHSLVQRANAALTNVKTLLLSNLLTLKERKTEFIVFFRKQRTIPQQPDKVCFGNSHIKRVKIQSF